VSFQFDTTYLDLQIRGMVDTLIETLVPSEQPIVVTADALHRILMTTAHKAIDLHRMEFARGMRTALIHSRRESAP